jgi:hypothetical protein
VPQTVKWLPKPQKHDFQAAEDYLSPILLLRGDDAHPLIMADGYHRVCASYWIDENTDIPCILI